MPTRKPLDRYPTEYADLFFRVRAQGIVILKFDSEEAAKRVRRDLYNYRLALWEETPRPPTQHNQTLLDIADTLTIRLRNSNLFVSLRDSAFSALINEQLESMIN